MQVCSEEDARHMGLSSFLRAYLGSLLRIFGGSLPSTALGPIVSRKETVCKYQLEKDDIRKKDGTLKYRALLPASNGKRSVFRISGLSDPEIWNIGLEKVARIRCLPLLGRFDLKAALVYDQNLNILPDEDLSSRHANIVGWPEEKEKQRSIAQVLAAEAVIRNRTQTDRTSV